MPKRKVISESDNKTETTKKLKGERNAEESSQSQLSFESPRQCAQSFVYPKTLDEFFEEFWEKKHLYIERKNPKYYGDMCSKKELLALVGKEELIFESDLFVSRYSKDEEASIEATGKATASNLKKYLEKEKASVMLSRPHRYNKDIETILQLLELYFGCCAYAHLEVTPAASQGHAPCYVGREVFNLQLEGKKRWRLYKPIIELATHDSEDLDEAEIGEVLHEYILEPGDVLYLPRGTVFQANSFGDKYSTDISIELYDEISWGKFISSIIDKAVEDACLNDVSFREGLPINYLSYMGFEKNENNAELIGQSNSEKDIGSTKTVPRLDQNAIEKQQKFKAKLQTLFSSLVNHLDAHWGADYLGTWFMGNRLAPTLPEKPAGKKAPEDDSLVQMTYPEHVRIVYCKPGEGVFKGVDADQEDEDEEEDDDTEEDGGEENGEDEETKADEEQVVEQPKKQDKNKTSKAASKKDREEEKVQKKPESTKNSKEAKSAKKDKAEEDESVPSEEEEDEAMEADDSGDLDTSDVEQKPCIIVQHSVQNESNDDTVMVPGILEFPVHYNDALLILHRTNEPVAVKDLPLTAEERLDMTSMLWVEGLLEVKESE